MSAGPLDIRDVGHAIEQQLDRVDRRLVQLQVQVGDPTDEHPAHLVVGLSVSPAAIELLQGLAGARATDRLGPLLERALVEAIDAELDDLRARMDTLTAALQAAGPSPLRVPPTGPSPAPASSPRPLAALPGGRTDDADEPPDPDPAASAPDADADAAGAAAAPRPPAAATPARPRTARAARRPAGTGALRKPLRAAAPSGAATGAGAFALPPLRERIVATLADLPAGETLSSGELQRRCRASQPSVDKALRELVAAGQVERLGEKGKYRYQAAKRTTPTTPPPPPSGAGAAPAGKRQDGGASSAPPPAARVRTPLPNGKTGKLSGRPSGSEGSTFGGRVLALLQMSDLWPEAVCQRIAEPLADVEKVLEELRAEEDISRLPDGRYRAVL